MKAHPAALLLACLLAPSAQAQWEEERVSERAEPAGEVGWVKAKQEPVAPWATGFLDPKAYTRYGLVSRSTFSDGTSAFSDALAWALEGHLQVRLTEGWAITAVVPFGLVRQGGATEAFLGNVGVGVSAGGLALQGEAWTLRWAAGLDVTAPTVGKPANEGAMIQRSTAAAIRGTAPYLYVPRLMTAVARGHLDATHDWFTAELELGLAPAGVVGTGGGFVFLGQAQGRVSARLGAVAEPYLEAGVMRQLAGAGSIAPPLWITPGVRLHIADAFDPAIFVSFNFEEASAVVIGLELTALHRPTKGTVTPEQPREFLDF
ncbi:MAG: hypothetical protein H6730_27525 [Deltaproteobacteria bacterium]|nr:hypothetical protein [Deltaproteobacteria bacterium]